MISNLKSRKPYTLGQDDEPRVWEHFYTDELPGVELITIRCSDCNGCRFKERLDCSPLPRCNGLIREDKEDVIFVLSDDVKQFRSGIEFEDRELFPDNL